MKALSYLVKIRTGTGSADGEQIVRINVPVIVAIQVLKKLLCAPRLRFVEEHCGMQSNETEESSSKKKKVQGFPWFRKTECCTRKSRAARKLYSPKVNPSPFQLAQDPINNAHSSLKKSGILDMFTRKCLVIDSHLCVCTPSGIQQIADIVINK